MSQNIPSLQNLKTKILFKFHLDNLALNDNNTLKILIDENIHNPEESKALFENASNLPLFSTACNLVIIDNKPVKNYSSSDSETAGQVLWNIISTFQDISNKNKAILITNTPDIKHLGITNKDVIFAVGISYCNSMDIFQDDMFSFQNEKAIDTLKVMTLQYADKYGHYKYRVEFTKENEIQDFEVIDTGNSQSYKLSPSDPSLKTNNNPAIFLECMGQVFEQVDEAFFTPELS